MSVSARDATLRYSLLAEGCMRLSVQMSYTAVLLLAYEQAHRASDLGFVSAALVLPSLVFVKWSARVRDSLVAWRCLFWSWIARIAAIGLAGFAGRRWALLTALAAVMGLSQQILQTSKLALDAWIVPPERRLSFSGLKASIASLATILGPALIGGIAGALGLKPAVALVAAVSVLGLGFSVAMKTGGLLSQAQTTPDGDFAAGSLLSLVFRRLEMGITLVTYVLVLIILGMEAPLLFPFVAEVYRRGPEYAGRLLSVCGVGSLLGALIMRQRRRPLSPIALIAVLMADGAILMVAMTGIPMAALLALFAALGVISSAALISTETQIQNSVPARQAAPLFSLMTFAGGAGAAAMTVVSTSLAQRWGAAQVLFACGGLEIAIGGVAMAGLALWAPRLQAEALNG